MIVQVDIVKNGKRDGAQPLSKTGFYRIMVVAHSNEDLPSYWMFNGTWHWRFPPDLNPPRPWFL